MTEPIAQFLAPIKERLAAATPGPWEAKPYIVYGEQDDSERVRVKSPYDGPDYNTAEMLLPTDAEFIAAVPADLCRLLAAVEGVVELHEPVLQRQWGPHRPMCRHDSFDWPCPTINGLAAALGPAPKTWKETL